MTPTSDPGSPGASMASVGALAVPGLPEVQAGDDLSRLILEACAAAGLPLEPGDVLVVSSKVVSKAMSLTRPTARAADRDAVVDEQSARLVARRRSPRGPAQIVQSVAGPVMAAAGVDASNTAPGTVLVLPPDPDAAARDLRARLHEQGAPLVAVVVSDTAGRPWRVGQTDFALGVAGLRVVDDLRGSTDTSGQQLAVTERALADEVAALADLVKGKVAGVPVALVRGLAPLVTPQDGPGARALLRDPASDWFRLGHVEAVWSALGVDPGGVDAQSVLPEPVADRVSRACAVALSGNVMAPGGVMEPNGVMAPGGAHPTGTACTALDDGAGGVRGVELRGPDDFGTGVLVSRLLTALWAEDLAGRAEFDRGSGVAIVTIDEAGEV